MNKNFDYKFKCIFFGNYGVGKSSLMYRYGEGDMFKAHEASFGGFLSKTIKLLGKEIKLMLYDSCGAERFRILTEPFYRETKVGFLLFDLSRRESLKGIEKSYIEPFFDFTAKNKSEGSILILIGNKTDLINGDSHEVRKIALQIAFKFNLQYFETSAKTGDSVEKTISTAINECVIKEEKKKIKAEKKKNNNCVII